MCIRDRHVIETIQYTTSIGLIEFLDYTYNLAGDFLCRAVNLIHQRFVGRIDLKFFILVKFLRIFHKGERRGS